MPELLGYGADDVRAAEAPLLAAGEPLMRRAANALAAELRRLVPRAAGSRDRPRRILLLVGSGDNGGDTLFAGAELAAEGDEVIAAPVGSRMRDDAAEAARAAGVRFVAESPSQLAERAAASDLVVDGILGIGAGSAAGRSPALRGTAREVVTALLPVVAAREPGRHPLVVAVDLPSGIDPDTGEAPDPAVLPADLTVTFGALKAGLLIEPGATLAGEIRLVDIGLGPGLAGAHPLVTVPGRGGDHRIRRRVLVRGRVQGVGFRWATREQAESLGVTGWVRNTGDGSVEAELEGEPDAVARLLRWVRSGPPGAHVADVTTTEIPAVPTGTAGFDIRH